MTNQPKIDTAALLDAHPIAEIVRARTALAKDGAEFKGRCPFHDDRTSSFYVVRDKGFYHCFGCGAHGDGIDFIMTHDGVGFRAACDLLGGGDFQPRRTRSIPALQLPPTGQIIAGKPTPPVANPKRADDRDRATSIYTPAAVYDYRDMDGALLGHVLRIELAANSKAPRAKARKWTPTIRWMATDPDRPPGWTLAGFDKPRPLYGLDRLAAQPNAPVLVVEGEKAADAGATILPDWVTIAWPGGAHAAKHANWHPLAGRTVTIMPDADPLGATAAAVIAQTLTQIGAQSVTALAIDPTKPKGWDLADAVAEACPPHRLLNWFTPRAAGLHMTGPGVDGSREAPPQEAEPRGAQADESFTALGHGAGSRYFYLCHGSQQIVELAAAGHTKNALLELALLSYWRAICGNKRLMGAWPLVRPGGVFRRVIFVAGGAWLDEALDADTPGAGRAVLHHGPAILVDGYDRGLDAATGKYIYERAPSIGLGAAKILTSKDPKFQQPDATALADIAAHLSWENPLSGALLAGFFIVAPVCGLLDWRPHLWLTGPSGSGKTTVVEDIAKRVIGPIGLNFEGFTSEAAIRQTLGRDARPVILDEAERENEKSAAEMRRVLNLARVPSSGGEIAKGGAGGRPTSYCARSCFFFASINPPIEHCADASRITTLALKLRATASPAAVAAAEAHYAALAAMIANRLTPGYAAAMLIRTLDHVEVLRANIATITRVAAGYHLCRKAETITQAAAKTWIAAQDWTRHTALTAPKDEQRLLDKPLTHRARIQTSQGPRDIPLGVLIAYAAGRGEAAEIPKDVAARELRRTGILVQDPSDEHHHDGETVAFCNGADQLKQTLTGTPWAATYGDQLRHLYRAKLTNPKRFAPGIRGRASALPISAVIESAITVITYAWAEGTRQGKLIQIELVDY